MDVSKIIVPRIDKIFVCTAMVHLEFNVLHAYMYSISKP